MLRVLTTSDIDAVLRVQRQAYRLPQLLERPEVFRRKMDLFPDGAIGEFKDATLVGYVFFHPWKQGEIVSLDTEIARLPDQPDCIYIHDLSVVPECHGRGIAKALFSEVRRVAGSLGISRYTLVAVQDSEPFWARLGFRPLATLEYASGVAATKMVMDRTTESDFIARRARLSDVSAIFEMGRSDRAFEVSDSIRFYEKAELELWAESPQDNVLLVLESQSQMAGFLFCKIISSHWAMLDNFYVKPSFRNRGGSRVLMDCLLTELHTRGIQYVSTLAAVDSRGLDDYLTHHGFKWARSYHWYELFRQETLP